MLNAINVPCLRPRATRRLLNLLGSGCLLIAVSVGVSACGTGSESLEPGSNELGQDEDALVRACSQRFYRMSHPSRGTHFYSMDPDEIDEKGDEGYVVEDEVVYACGSASFPSLVPFYRYHNAATADYFFTTRGGGREIGGGYTFEGVAAYLFSKSTRNRTRLYRFWSDAKGIHFYTTFSNNVAGYTLEDEVIYVYAEAPPAESPTPAVPIPQTPEPQPSPPVDPLPDVRFAQRFVADAGANAAQCNGAFSGSELVAFGQWTSAIRIDTDGRWGGCKQQFGLLDPKAGLSGLRLSVNFYAEGDGGQCGSPGIREFPIVTTGEVQYTSEYLIDTDGRWGGCAQVFSLEGRSDLALDVEFLADGDAGQCGNTGLHTAVAGTPVQLKLDMDNRNGGCRQRFRLRER